MQTKVMFKEELSKLLFLNVKQEAIEDIFKIKIESDIDLPIRAVKVTENINNGVELNNIPISLFIEGMFFVLGADENFIFNKEYKKSLSNFENSTRIIKAIIFEELKKNNLLESYIMLKGLITIEENKDNYDKLLSLCEALRIKDKDFEEEEIILINKLKNIEDYSTPYLYEATINKEKQDYQAALISLNKYLTLGGKTSGEIEELNATLKFLSSYNLGIELSITEPKKALEILLPLIEEGEETAIIYYHVAVSYRNLQNYEKAIYYLNESMAIDSALAEVINELGINYAALGDFSSAVLYLRKAFEATKAIEICTNLVMCYLNLGDMEQARLHLEIGKKIDGDDETVRELAGIMG
jgi:tetratricopeptide (TPR) repeat protein